MGIPSERGPEEDAERVAQQAAAAEVVIDPLAGPASGFNAIVDGDAVFGDGEMEGPLAVGGNLGAAGSYRVAIHDTGTFVDDGDAQPSALVVGGRMDWANSTASGQMSVLNSGYAKVADTAGADILATDQNGAQVSTHIVPAGSTYDATPRVDLTTHQDPASVGPHNPLEFSSLFADYRERSQQMAACQNTVQLLDQDGQPLADQENIPPGSNVHIRLTPGQTNVLHITGENLNNISNLTFDTPPSADTPLLVDVDTTGSGGDYTWTPPTLAGASAQTAPYTIWNFPDATHISQPPSASSVVEGTIYAPNAAIDDESSANVEGTVVSSAYNVGTDSNAGEIHYYPFAARLTCQTAEPSPSPSPTVSPSPSPTVSPSPSPSPSPTVSPSPSPSPSVSPSPSPSVSPSPTPSPQSPSPNPGPWPSPSGSPSPSPSGSEEPSPSPSPESPSPSSDVPPPGPEGTGGPDKDGSGIGGLPVTGTGAVALIAAGIGLAAAGAVAYRYGRRV